MTKMTWKTNGRSNCISAIRGGIWRALRRGCKVNISIWVEEFISSSDFDQYTNRADNISRRQWQAVEHEVRREIVATLECSPTMRQEIREAQAAWAAKWAS